MYLVNRGPRQATKQAQSSLQYQNAVPNPFSFYYSIDAARRKNKPIRYWCRTLPRSQNTMSTAANKKQKTSNEPVVTATKSPYQLWQERYREVEKAQKAVGQIPFRGPGDLHGGDDDDSCESEEEPKVDRDKFSQEEVDYIRTVIINPGMNQALEMMEELILGEQRGCGFMMFDTSFSYVVLDAFDEMKRLHGKAKSWANKLNYLFGYTFIVARYDVWMQDHECGWGGEKMIKDLAKMWKKVLSKSDEDLGIDGAFTRPGLVCFLEGFKEKVEEIEAYEDPEIKFPFA